MRNIFKPLQYQQPWQFTCLNQTMQVRFLDEVSLFLNKIEQNTKQTNKIKPYFLKKKFFLNKFVFKQVCFLSKNILWKQN